MITNHTQLLNYLITRYNLKSYLEIGVQRPENNFDKVKCNYKVGVDPEIKSVLYPGLVCIEKTDKNEVGDYLNHYELNGCTSDEFFNTIIRGVDNGFKRSFQICFIDGLHHADQVHRDFENSIRCLHDNGFIILHDSCPADESTTHVPRDSRVWHGDVYKFAMNLNYDNIKYITLDIDCGMTVVWKSNLSKKENNPTSLDWTTYIDNKSMFLNIIPPADLEKHLPCLP